MRADRGADGSCDALTIEKRYRSRLPFHRFAVPPRKRGRLWVCGNNAISASPASAGEVASLRADRGAGGSCDALTIEKRYRSRRPFHRKRGRLFRLQQLRHISFPRQCGGSGELASR
ncbi:hypothetical protein HMPREF9081_2042 [Centipeda periodontii DSM 2778]|uniref:Uncharacterized protein n=1 Tax=Centipeda periodontii DSM 2778 TaxID=888060 RepID=F5RP56_9FIRM|nr:hypothetical protein HMPREF9081_2042 [Centipeda periodontii DSM 2778]